jgi:hypothetical protein
MHFAFNRQNGPLGQRKWAKPMIVRREGTKLNKK